MPLEAVHLSYGTLNLSEMSCKSRAAKTGLIKSRQTASGRLIHPDRNAVEMQYRVGGSDDFFKVIFLLHYLQKVIDLTETNVLVVL